MLKRIFLTGLMILSSVSAMAASADYHEELKYFQYVLRFSGMSDKKLESYLNPFIGPQSFRLNAQDAPWAGNYFPMADGGIAHRWREGVPADNPPSKEALVKMSARELRNLSPVEKYDILMGAYDYPATRHELTNRGPQRDLAPEIWEGFCNGIRCAGIMLKEPKYPVEMTNPDGIKVFFSPADLKALAGASYFYVEKYGQLGGPTQSENVLGVKQPNPAIFDLTLRYHLGKHKKAFIIDAHTGTEIWNESVVGFRRQLGPVVEVSDSEKAQYPGAVSKVRVNLNLDTLGEMDIKSSNHATKHLVADGTLIEPLESAYVLFLDREKRALGGEWINVPGTTRGVDFAWFVGGRGTDDEQKTGNRALRFQEIQKLFKRSLPQCSNLFW